MPRRRWKDFRSGDWNEDLGILMLKGFAAVASVPRPEDFGLDAIATLLRNQEESGYLYAEDSFYVQLKSASTKKIIYKNDEIQWLRDMQLPFFIGVVKKGDCSIQLFPGHKLNQMLIQTRKYKELHVFFSEQGKQQPIEEASKADVFLG